MRVSAVSVSLPSPPPAVAPVAFCGCTATVGTGCSAMLAGPGVVLSCRTPTTLRHSRVFRVPFRPPRLQPGMRPLSLQRRTPDSPRRPSCTPAPLRATP
eukprot:1108397-Rhodomonas_salina.1